jgi:hypothetical protein
VKALPTYTHLPTCQVHPTCHVHHTQARRIPISSFVHPAYHSQLSLPMFLP